MSTEPAPYPPEHHVLRDLAIETELVELDRVRGTAPVDDAVRDRSGNAAVGFMVAVVDVAAALVALSGAHPDWIATADLSLHSTGPLHDGPLLIDARLVRAGSKLLTIAAELSDGHGERRAVADLTFARIPRKASVAAPDFGPEQLLGQRRVMEPADEPRPGTLAERIGLTVVDAGSGVVELDKSDYVRNSFGTINGGVLGVVFQAAAEAAVPGMVAVDIQILYLNQTEVGPARTRTTVLRRAADHAVCRIDAVDAGASDRLLARATVTLQRGADR